MGGKARTGKRGAGEDVQRGSYQHNFIIYTRKAENVIVTIQILSCRRHFLPAWQIHQWQLKHIVTFAFQLISIMKWKNCNEQHLLQSKHTVFFSLRHWQLDIPGLQFRLWYTVTLSIHCKTLHALLHPPCSLTCLLLSSKQQITVFSQDSLCWDVLQLFPKLPQKTSSVL